jgi:hypothetical protein
MAQSSASVFQQLCLIGGNRKCGSHLTNAGFKIWAIISENWKKWKTLKEAGTFLPEHDSIRCQFKLR